MKSEGGGFVPSTTEVETVSATGAAKAVHSYCWLASLPYKPRTPPSNEF